MTDVPTPPRVAGVDLRSGTLKIIAPARGTYPQVAERLRRALKDTTGQNVTITDDSASPDATGTVVALGNLMDSAFVKRLYLAWFDWTDAAWPGPGGWALRVVADPWATGGHVVLAGGSDEGGVAAAAEALARRVERDGTMLPALHEAHLGARAGDYRKMLDPMLAPGYDWREAGGGGSGSWDFMMRIADAGKGFLYTGEARFLELYRDQLLRFFNTHWFNRRREEPVQIHGFVHHMLLPWELTEHQPVYSEGHRRQIFESFLHLYRSTEGAARPALLNQVRRRNVRGNHDTRNALDLYFGGRYFHRVARLPEAQDWLRLADDFLAPQAGSSKPWEDSWGHQWSASLYNVAVYKAAVGDEAYFRSRPFLDAVDRAIIAHSNLRRGPVNYFAIAAVATGNREYLHPVVMLRRQEQGSKGAEEQGRGHPRTPSPHLPIGKGGSEGILAGRLGGDEVGRAFWTGQEAVEPGRLLGVAVAPLDRLYHETAKERDGAYASVAMENVPWEKGFDKLSFRDGFDVRDQYLLLDGISGGGHSYQDANCIVSFEALGKVWINAFATGGRPASVREQNGVNIVRDGQGPGREPRFACLHDAGDFGGWGATGSSMLDLNGAAWHRHIFWRRGSYFLVVDEVEAQEGGDYLIEPTWYVSGEVKAEGRVLTASQGEAAHLTAQHTGSTWTETHRRAGDRQRRSEITRWRQRLKESLKAGDRHALATLFYATERPMPEMFRLRRTAEGWRVEDERGGTAFGLRGCAREGDMVEARAWTVSPEEVLLWGCSWLACGGLLLAASSPVGMRITNYEPRSANYEVRHSTFDLRPSTFDRGVEFWAREEVELRIKAPPGVVSVEHAETGEGYRVWTDGEGKGTIQLRAGRSRLNLSAAQLSEGLRALLDAGRAVKEPPVEAPKVPAKRGKDLSPKFETRLEGAANAIVGGEGGFGVGTDGGVVASVGLNGKVRWSFRSEKPIRALLRQDLDGDGEAETAAGGDAETLYLFGSDGKERWRGRIVWQPMQWENWSQLDCKVLSLGAGDLNGDGRVEIVAGGADRHCYAFSLDGERLWRSPVQWGPMVCCAVADADGDGRPEVLGGTADPAIHGHCIVYRGDGKFDRNICRPDVQSWSIPSWMVTMATEDLDGDGRVEILNGVDTNHRQLIVYRYEQGVVWDADFGGGVSAVAVGGPAGDRTVYGGSAGGFVQAFTSKGERLWWRFLAERVAGLAAFGERVAVATSPGTVGIFDAAGKVRQAFRLPAGVRSVAGWGDLLVLGREDGIVQGFKVV